ncbi:MAG: glycosyltransferase family 39 protein [Candidatus Levybacteria bacterium]|nr:glycosyltransferase family 39 protein [Candidatus Levybacteria bacterium]
MSKKITFILLIGVIVLASILRLWQLGKVPPSPDWDEASLGYNAYSIMQTGRDEYGKFLPVVLRSFDDYKPALYAYFVIPFIKLVGLNIYAVRLPAVIFGILAVLATFLLVKELLSNVKTALLASFFMAISPWHLQFSRIAFESGVGMAFNIFSALFFIKGLKKPLYLSLSFALMSLNLYIYQSEKVFTPILAVILIIVFRKQLFSISKKYLMAALIIGAIISLPIINFTFTDKEALARAKGVSVFADSTPLLKENVQKIIEDKKNNDFIGLVLDNRRIVFAKTTVSGYLSHFDLNWLFITGDIARHHAPNMGLLYLWDLLFLFIGIFVLLFGKFDKKVKFLLFLWFLAAPIPASITSGVPHAVRTLNFLPTFQIFIAIGVLFAAQKISNFKFQIKYPIYVLVLLFFIFNFSYYLNQYFIQQNYFNAKEWQYGYKDAISIVKKVENNYKKIVVSNQPPMDQSYIFFLFYLEYPSSLYQKEAQYSSGGFRENHAFGKFEFRPIEWSKENRNGDTLYIGRPNHFQDSANVLARINYPDGQTAIELVE